MKYLVIQLSERGSVSFSYVVRPLEAMPPINKIFMRVYNTSHYNDVCIKDADFSYLTLPKNLLDEGDSWNNCRLFIIPEHK
jgi:hypothetical protein